MIHNKRKQFRGVFAFLGLVLLLSAGGMASCFAADSKEAYSRKHTLVIGKVSSNPKKHYAYIKPILDYVVQNMGDIGIKQGKVLLVKDNKQMIRYIKRGKVDWITETPFSAVIFEEKSGAEMLLRKWKKGVPEYHTVFITRKNSGINSLEKLKGKTIAFEDPGSTTAFYVPFSVLKEKGFDLEELETPREKPGASNVGYVFARQEINMSTWVHKGLVAAAAYSNLDWIKEDHTPKAFKKDLRIFHKTRSFPRAIELVRKDLDPKIKQRLKDILLNAHNDPKAKTALRRYQKTTKFDELDERAKAGMEEVRKILRIVRSEEE